MATASFRNASQQQVFKGVAITTLQMCRNCNLLGGGGGSQLQVFKWMSQLQVLKGSQLQVFSRAATANHSQLQVFKWGHKCKFSKWSQLQFFKEIATAKFQNRVATACFQWSDNSKFSNGVAIASFEIGSKLQIFKMVTTTSFYWGCNCKFSRSVAASVSIITMGIYGFYESVGYDQRKIVFIFEFSFSFFWVFSKTRKCHCTSSPPFDHSCATTIVTTHV